MNIVPIVFAFDNNLVFPACVSISSLMMSAASDTFYDIFILYPGNKDFNRSELDRIPDHYPNCRLNYIAVGDVFDKAFEIRGITTPAYYRLLIPELIPQYDKILYSDVDVIFRSDLSEFYDTDMTGCYFAGVPVKAQYHDDMKKHFLSLGLKPSEVIYDGNMVINSRLIREDGIMPKLVGMAGRKFKFQEMDIINIVCQGHIRHLPPSFCLTADLCLLLKERCKYDDLWDEATLQEALDSGIVHYNGNKPWNTWCVNFDIWWEYYRKSPFFDRQFYFDFFYKKLDEYDRLPLLKRIKILARWFVFGKKR